MASFNYSLHSVMLIQTVKRVVGHEFTTSTVSTMQRNYNFKEISALLDEINNLKARFKKFVSKISSVEELASNLELELLALLERLQEALSDNGYGAAVFERGKNIKKKLCNRNRLSMEEEDSPARLTPSPAGHHEEMVELYNAFQGLGKRCSNLANRIDSIDGSASNLFSALGGIQKRLKNLINRDMRSLFKTEPFPIPPNMKKIPKDLSDVLALSAEKGVSSLGTKRLANGKAVFEIEGNLLTLPPRLSDLLLALAKDSGPSEDNLVGYKTLEEIAQWVLGPKRGWPPPNRAAREKIHHSTIHSIHLLRKEFRAAGINPYLIQRNRRLGYRFALRRMQESRDSANPP